MEDHSNKEYLVYLHEYDVLIGIGSSLEEAEALIQDHVDESNLDFIETTPWFSENIIHKDCRMYRVLMQNCHGKHYYEWFRVWCREKRNIYKKG